MKNFSCRQFIYHTLLNCKNDLIFPKQRVTLIIIKIMRLVKNFNSLIGIGLFLWLTVNYHIGLSEILLWNLGIKK